MRLRRADESFQSLSLERSGSMGAAGAVDSNSSYGAGERACGSETHAYPAHSARQPGRAGCAKRGEMAAICSTRSPRSNAAYESGLDFGLVLAATQLLRHAAPPGYRLGIAACRCNEALRLCTGLLLRPTPCF